MTPVLPILLLVGVCVVLGLLVLAALAFVLALGRLVIGGVFPPVALWMLIGCGVVLTRIVWSAARGMRTTPERPAVVPISREHAPDLWRLVEDLAARLETTAPTELWLTAEANATVSESAPLRGRRRMDIGAPLLVTLSAAEMRAVLSHELGHFVQGHTRLGPVTYRGWAVLAAVRRTVTQAALTNMYVAVFAVPALATLNAYGRLYDGISFSIRRRQELDADAAAARVAGRDVTANALRSADMAAAAWHDFGVRLLDPMLSRGSPPDDPVSAFQAMINDPDYRTALTEYRRRPPAQRTPNPRDSHPPLPSRLAALAQLPAVPVPRDPRLSMALLDNPKRLFRRLGRQLAGHAGQRLRRPAGPEAWHAAKGAFVPPPMSRTDHSGH